jgi:hypothetical protein
MGTYGSNSTDSSFLINFSILRCVSAGIFGIKRKNSREGLYLRYIKAGYRDQELKVILHGYHAEVIDGIII